MSEFDADLKRMFAHAREDFDGAAFRADVEQRIARARKRGYLADAALALGIGVAAMVAVPVAFDVVQMLTADVLDPGLAFSATPLGAALTAGVAAVAALVWART